jgi:hypothetical protein
MDSESTEPGQGNPGQPTDMIELKTFSLIGLAELARANLEAHSIACWLTADDCGGMLPGMDVVRGVKLLVRASDRDAANEVLASQFTPSDQPGADEFAPEPAPEKDSPPQTRLSLPQLAAGVAAGVLLCLLYQWTSRFGTKTYRYDSDGDGKTDEIVVFRNGRLVEQSFDRNSDGRLDAWEHYDSASKRILSKADDNFDGVPDVTWYYAGGLATSSSVDTDFNGTPDVTHTFKNELVVQSDWRPNGTNIITLRQFFRHGVLTEESRDTNMDGSFDLTIRYDAFQNVIQTNAFMLLSPASR